MLSKRFTGQITKLSHPLQNRASAPSKPAWRERGRSEPGAGDPQGTSGGFSAYPFYSPSPITSHYKRPQPLTSENVPVFISTISSRIPIWNLENIAMTNPKKRLFPKQKFHSQSSQKVSHDIRSAAPLKAAGHPRRHGPGTSWVRPSSTGEAGEGEGGPGPTGCPHRQPLLRPSHPFFTS